MTTIEWRTSHNIRIDVPLASIGTRLGAYLIDGVIKFAFLFTLFFIIARIGSGDFGIWTYFILLSPVAFYSLLFESLNDGQTPGKKICKIKVTAQDGRAPGTEAFFVRWIFRLIDFQLFQGLIALIVASASKKRQRIGDMLANTVVVNTNVISRHIFDSFTKVPEHYTPLYPKAASLHAEEVRLIKDVLRMEMSPKRTELIAKLTRQLCEKYQLKQDQPDRRFLFSLVKDYNFYLRQS